MSCRAAAAREALAETGWEPLDPRPLVQFDELPGLAAAAQPGTPVDHQAETRKLATITTSMTLQMAADDPGYGAALAAQLGTAGGAGARIQPCCAIPARLRRRAGQRAARRRCGCPGGGGVRQGLGRRQPGQPPARRSARSRQATASPMMSCWPPPWPWSRVREPSQPRERAAGYASCGAGSSAVN